jgi:hypothetical protein
MKNAVFWDVALCGSVIRVAKMDEVGATFAVTTNRITLRFSVTLVLTRATWLNIPGDGILYSHRRENLKSYIALTGWAL